jgi:hypothetical protein
MTIDRGDEPSLRKSTVGRGVGWQRTVICMLELNVARRGGQGDVIIRSSFLLLHRVKVDRPGNTLLIQS